MQYKVLCTLKFVYDLIMHSLDCTERLTERIQSFNNTRCSCFGIALNKWNLQYIGINMHMVVQFYFSNKK